MTTDRTSSAYSRELEAQTRGHTCECGADVVVAWVGGKFHIKCNKCGLDPALKRIKSYWELWNAGESVPSYIRQNIQRQDDKERRAKTWTKFS